MASIVNYHDVELVLFEWEFLKVFYIAHAISFLSTSVGNLNKERVLD